MSPLGMHLAPWTVQPFGDDALRIVLPDDACLPALERGLASTPGIVDWVLTEGFAMLRLATAPALPDELLGSLRRWAAERTPAPGTTHVVPVRYDGPDLVASAASLGLSTEELVAQHVAAPYVVRFIGFLPGFAYLGPLPERLRLPRRPSPRPRVPAGAVAIAGPFTAVYPHASPGGWHLLGHAVGSLPFDPAVGCRLRLGDAVRFEAVP